MFRKKPVFKYESTLIGYTDTISPAKDLIPDWYKSAPQWKDSKFFDFEKGFSPPGVKLCMPFFDSLTTGYMVKLPYDLYVKKDDKGERLIGWPKGVNLNMEKIMNSPSSRETPSHKNLIPVGHYPKEFTWNSCVSYSVPKGYSFIYTHPFNRFDLPFTTLTGIVDGGFINGSHGNTPFFLKEDFEGVIEQGTPIAQIIPFRQEKWKSKKIEGLSKIGAANDEAASIVFRGWYKKTFWTRKSYE